MQVFLSFCLIAAPTAAILWFARDIVFADDADLAREYFSVTPLFESVWRVTLYTFIKKKTTWVAVVVTSVLSCLFIRWTAASPGLYPRAA